MRCSMSDDVSLTLSKMKKYLCFASFFCMFNCFLFLCWMLSKNYAVELYSIFFFALSFILLLFLIWKLNADRYFISHLQIFFDLLNGKKYPDKLRDNYFEELKPSSNEIKYLLLEHFSNICRFTLVLSVIFCLMGIGFCNILLLKIVLVLSLAVALCSVGIVYSVECLNRLIFKIDQDFLFDDDRKNDILNSLNQLKNYKFSK